MRVARGVEEGRRLLARSVQGHWEDISPALLDSFAQRFGERLTPPEAVARILADVRAKGDEALREYTQRLDGVELASLEVPREEWRKAYMRTPRGLRQALRAVARRVEEFQRASLPRSWVDYVGGYGELFTPLERVGIYIPGGTALYPSTVLMTVVPARVAGVREIVMAFPSPGAGASGAAVLAAAYIAGVDRVFQIGGAQAIAAMAYGTDTVPRVDMVCGPGGLFVTLAKRMVYGHVGVDGLYGPSETIVVADDQADPVRCAADLLGQAEHDPLASPIFITTSERLLSRVEEQIARQLQHLSRKDVAAAALEAQGAAVLVDTLEEAVELANLYAPEHLCLSVADPWSLVRSVRNAGGVFVGEGSPEVLGDYVAGPSHVMPTGATARFSSPLGVHQFLKVTSLVGMDAATVAALVPIGVQVAKAEGFDAHARALRLRQPRRRRARGG